MRLIDSQTRIFEMALSALDVASHNTDRPPQESPEIVEVMSLFPPVATYERFELGEQLFDRVQVR